MMFVKTRLTARYSPSFLFHQMQTSLTPLLKGFTDPATGRTPLTLSEFLKAQALLEGPHF